MAQIDVDVLIRWIQRSAEVIAENREYLTDLDAAIGDADHGGNMTRGTKAASDKLAQTPPATIGEFGKTVGMTLVSTVGGASGPLFGTFFMRLGQDAGDADSLDVAGLAKALRAGYEGVVARGKAEPGDKTMLDAWEPALKALDEAAASGDDAADAIAKAADAADAGRDATKELVAKKGRASYLGERALGHLDPGAASTALLVRALADELKAAA
mgnify:CR=1 FL=1